MKISFAAVLALALLLPAALFAQQPPPVPAQPQADWLGRWERTIASPSYGLAAMIFQVYSAGQNGQKELGTLVLPGLDVRLFQGTNVEQRGGFFVGWEIGLTAFFTPGEAQSFKDTYPVGSLKYNVNVESGAGLVYLMAKYGYRLDLGIDMVGLSFGFEMGIGGRMFNGHVALKNEKLQGPSGTFYASRDWDSGGAALDLCLDLAAETTLRLGKNFRLFAKGGALITPPVFRDSGNTSNFWNSGASNYSGPVTDENQARALFSRYKLEFLPVIPNIRAGFSVSY